MNNLSTDQLALINLNLRAFAEKKPDDESKILILAGSVIKDLREVQQYLQQSKEIPHTVNNLINDGVIQKVLENLKLLNFGDSREDAITFIQDFDTHLKKHISDRDAALQATISPEIVRDVAALKDGLEDLNNPTLSE